jgi:hypothetical protein
MTYTDPVTGDTIRKDRVTANSLKIRFDTKKHFPIDLQEEFIYSKVIEILSRKAEEIFREIIERNKEYEEMRSGNYVFEKRANS